MSPYWQCQLTAWSVYLLLAIGIPTLYGGMRWTVVLRGAVGVALGLALTQQLRRTMRRHEWLRLPLRRLVPRLILAGTIIAALMVLVLLPLLVMNITSARLAGPLATIFAVHLGFVLAWILAYAGHHSLRRVQMAESEKWRAELMVRDAELRALRAQLDPHFLFNSLNTVRALIVDDPLRAQTAVTGLAALLRYTLQLSRTRMTPLRREIEVTQHYLALEALRLEDRLRYSIAADPPALDRPVPPLLLQTLVENAVKHGIARLPQGGTVDIAIRDDVDALRLVVRNTGTLPPTRGDGGVGLDNARSRLHLLFGDRATLELRQSRSNEVTCTVELPRGLALTVGQAAGAPRNAEVT